MGALWRVRQNDLCTHCSDAFHRLKSDRAIVNIYFSFGGKTLHHSTPLGVVNVSPSAVDSALPSSHRNLCSATLCICVEGPAFCVSVQHRVSAENHELREYYVGSACNVLPFTLAHKAIQADDQFAGKGIGLGRMK